MVYKSKVPAPADFDENVDFFDHLVFDKNTCDFDEQFCGIEYLVELFMHSQSKAHSIAKIERIIACFFMSFASLIAAIIINFDMCGDAMDYAISNPSYSALLLLCFLFMWFHLSFSFNFIGAALFDFSRRKFLLQELTNALELNSMMKEKESIQYPTINFFDSQSLSTWLEARRIALAVGGRFTLRLHYLTLIFCVVGVSLTIGFMLFLGQYYTYDNLSIE